MKKIILSRKLKTAITTTQQMMMINNYIQHAYKYSMRDYIHCEDRYMDYIYTIENYEWDKLSIHFCTSINSSSLLSLPNYAYASAVGSFEVCETVRIKLCIFMLIVQLIPSARYLIKFFSLMVDHI